MLAAETAWRVLRTEHEEMRRLAMDLARCFEKPDWHAGAQLVIARNLVHALRGFDESMHQPKGVALLAALRRHDEMHDLLDLLAHEAGECRRLLAELAELLDRVDPVPSGLAAKCIELLRDHNALLAVHLAREDVELKAQALARLSKDDWSQIVSSMSRLTGRRRDSPRR